MEGSVVPAGVAGTRACPDCSTVVPVDDGYVPWCHECGWNVVAPDHEPPHGRLDRVYASVGKRLGDRLVSELIAADRLQARLTPARVTAYAIAVEYLADALAASVAGTAAEIASHEKLLLDSTLDAAVQRTVHARRAAKTDLFPEIERAIVLVPERELERRRRVARLEDAKLDSTHPPTALRIRLLEERPRVEPALRLDDARSAGIDAELAPMRAEIATRLLDDYRAALYA